MPNQNDIPETVAECLDERYIVPEGVLEAVERYRDANPWAGTRQEKHEKLRKLHTELCEFYGIQARLEFADQVERGGAGLTDQRLIVMARKTSLVTYLHCLARYRGQTPREAFKFSLNLFNRVFPDKFAACNQVGPLLVKRAG